MKVWLNKNLEIAECYNIPHHEWGKILGIIKNNQKIFLKKRYEFKERENN